MKLLRVPAVVVAVLAGLIASAVACGQDVITAPSFKPGMAWVYKQREEATGRELGSVRIEVISVAADRVAASFTPEGGRSATERWDVAGNWEEVGTRGWPWLTRLAGNAERVTFVPALMLNKFPLQPGMTWIETLRATDPASGRKTEVQLYAKALKWEELVVPAGKFNALRVRRTITPEDGEQFRSRTTITLIDWYSPQVAGPIRRIVDWEYEDYRRPPGDRLVKGKRIRWELNAFAPAK